MKKALIPGASRGIGAAIARKLSQDGFEVFINYEHSKEKAEALARELGATAIRADVSDPLDVSRMFDEIGNINVLVCNAGISRVGLINDVTPQEWHRIFGVNTDGVYNCVKCALPHMIHEKAGAIITISSVWGVHGASCEAAYSASKAAVIGFTKALAKELGPSGIRVNCIAPGVIETDMMACFSDKDKEELAEDTPLGRLGTPEDVAELASFLASEKSSFITGQIIGVDGGFGQ